MITKRYLLLSLLIVVLLLRFRYEGCRSESNPLIRSPVIDGQTTGNGSLKIYSHEETDEELFDEDTDEELFDEETDEEDEYLFDEETDEDLFRPSQQEATTMIAWRTYRRSSGVEKAEALETIRSILSERAHVDGQIEMIGTLLYGSEDAREILYADGLPDQADDNHCIISTSRVCERYCGKLTYYSQKHMSTFANICYYSVDIEAFEKACVDTCGEKIMTADTDYSF